MTTEPPGKAAQFGSHEQSQCEVSTFINELIEGNEKPEELFTNLEHACNNPIRDVVYVKKYDCGESSSNENRLFFRRQAALYNRKMYNKFFVPVWAAAMNPEETVGYIMYPRLTPLTEVLQNFKIEIVPLENNELKLMEMLRRCFPPIALALDALHTPVPTRRTMYFHRDLSIKKVYLCESQASGTRTVYGDAMLKLSKLTRASHEKEINVSQSIIGDVSFPRQYFHHPELWKPGEDKFYLKRHDWFSYGVYIMEVLLNVLPVESAALTVLSYQTVDDYKDLRKKIKKSVGQEIKWNKPFTRDVILQYLSVAETCISLDQDHQQEMHREFLELKNRFETTDDLKFDPYHFEYGLSAWTADLLWVYDHSWTQNSGKSALSRPGLALGVSQKKKSKKFERVCQACLLHKAVKIPTKTFRRLRSSEVKDTMSHCDKTCGVYYCASCHTNGERLFCPDRHGTASSVLGHFASFALILYGDNRDQDKPNDIFEKDAYTLENALKHKLIIGIPEDNVVVAPLFDKEPGKEEECLIKACDEIRKRIHNRQVVGSSSQSSDICVNDANYTLFVYYSGHGSKGGEQDYQGHWCPSTEKHLLRWEVIDKHLQSLRNCPNLKNPTCKASCLQVISFMDHCGASSEFFSLFRKGTDKRAPLGFKASSRHDEKTGYSSEDNSVVTKWFCEFLRSQLCPKEKKCDPCSEIREYVFKKCHNAYLDGHSLRTYAEHILEDQRPDISRRQSEEPILAHFCSSGVRYRIFPYKEGDEVVEIKFDFKMSRDEVKRRLREELKSLMRKKGQHGKIKDNTPICLLENLPSDYSRFTLVSDSTVRNVLDSSLLYYSVIRSPAKVILQTKSQGRDLTQTLEDMELDESDLCALVQEYGDYESPLGKSQLPNILVHIVHHIRYKLYSGGVPGSEETRKTTSTAAGSKVSQPSSQTVPDSELLWNSFVGFVYDPPRPQQEVKNLTKAEHWIELEEEGKQYLRKGRNHKFKVEPDVAGAGARITWNMAEQLPVEQERSGEVTHDGDETAGDSSGIHERESNGGKDTSVVRPVGEAVSGDGYSHASADGKNASEVRPVSESDLNRVDSEGEGHRNSCEHEVDEEETEEEDNLTVQSDQV